MELSHLMSIFYLEDSEEELAEDTPGERRKRFRFPYRRDIDYSVAGGIGLQPSNNIARAEILDLSSGGFSLRTVGEDLEKGMVAQV